MADKRKEEPLTSDDERTGRTGADEEAEVREDVRPEDIKVIRENHDWEDDGAGEHEEEAGAEEKKSGKKKAKKLSKAELAAQFARKNEMLQKLRERLAETEEALESKEDRLKRLAAEFENYKKRTRKEQDLLKNQANAVLVSELLGILDDLDRAFEHAGDSIEHFRDGISLIHNSLLDLLKRNGLDEIVSAGKPFDPQFHEAVAHMNSDVVEEGVVAEVVLKGYMLNDQVIRPSRVVVSKGSVRQEPDAE